MEYDIFEGTASVAEDVGRSMSESVINSYPDVYEQLEDSVEDQFDFYDYNCEDEDENEEQAVKDQIRNELFSQDMAWETYELDLNKIPTKDKSILLHMFYNSPDEFLEKYAIH